MVFAGKSLVSKLNVSIVCTICNKLVLEYNLGHAGCTESSNYAHGDHNSAKGCMIYMLTGRTMLPFPEPGINRTKRMGELSRLDEAKS